LALHEIQDNDGVEMTDVVAADATLSLLSQEIEQAGGPLPKSVQTKAKADLHAIYEAASRADAEAAFDRFLAKYQARYDKAAGCLAKDREALLAFYDFPAEHWKHVRSTDEIDKCFVSAGAMMSSHGRPRGKERGGGWEPRRAA
jgi:hypothetical protein